MTYPTIDMEALENLAVLKEQFEANPEFLDKSPYAEDIRNKLQALFEIRTEAVLLREGEVVDGQKKRGRKSKAPALSDEQISSIEEEAVSLLKELKDLKALGKLDTDTKIQIIKAKTALIEKITNIQERFYNVRKVAHFQKVVIDILTDLVEEDNRAEFMKRLEPYLEG